MRALITGGTRGIGRHLAEALRQDGWDVGVVGRTPDTTLTRQLVGDVSDLWFPAQLRQRFLRWGWDTLDALLTCAAVAGPLEPVSRANLLAWREAIRVNVMGTFQAVHAVWPYLRHGARVITFGGGGDGPIARASAYAASKAAVARFSECLAEEAQVNGIWVNCVAPGPVRTDLLRQFRAAGISGEDCGPEAITACVRWLLSPAAEGITGRLISARFDDYLGWTKAISDTERATLRRVKP